MLLNSDKVSAIPARHHLSMVRESEAPVAALAPGEVEYLIREHDRGGVVARTDGDRPSSESLQNELSKVAGLLSNGTSVLE